MKKLLTILSVCAVISCTVCSCSKNNSTEDNTLMLTVNDQQLDKTIIQPVFDYFDGFNNDNPELVLSSFTPESYINQLKENGGYENEIMVNSENIKATHELWQEKYGENPVIEFVEETQNTPLTTQYLGFAKNYFAMTYYNLNTDFEIEEGYEYKFRYKVTGSESSEDGNETACIVKIKDDGWKLIFCSSELLVSYNSIPENESESE